MKKMHLLILIIAVTLLFNSCNINIDGFYCKEKDLYKKVELLEDENGSQSLLYNGISYYYDKFEFFSVWENLYCINNGDIMLGWTGLPSGLFYTQEYYSYSQNSPLFIYTLKAPSVYFCETYDYRLDTFIIEGTNSEIVFSDAIIEKPVYELYSRLTNVVLRSKNNPRVVSEIALHFKDGGWYVVTAGSYYFEITNEFKQLLIENGIING